MVMGLEVSRLARNFADWHRLIELCAIAGTLILDEDGLYDPATFNDRLLLGLKGELSQAELHFLKARMRGGVLNKARRGELEMRPPIGLVYLPDGSLGIDPDQEVQSAIRLVFDTFERTGSAMQTVRYLSRARSAVSSTNSRRRAEGRIALGPSRSPLESPRFCTTRDMLAPSSMAAHARAGNRRASTVSRKVPREEWLFLIRDVHPGYISWDRFEANQKRLAENILALQHAQVGASARGTGFTAGTRAVRSLRGTHGSSLLEQKKRKLKSVTSARKPRSTEARKCVSVCQAALWIERRAISCWSWSSR